MPVTGSGLVVPVLGDDPADLMGLPTSIAQLQVIAGQAPSGDGSNSVFLSSGHDCLHDTSDTLLTSTFTLTREQQVLVGAKVRFHCTTGATNAWAGIRIQVDGSTPTDTLTVGPLECSANGNAGDYQYGTIPTQPVLLLAGSHTITLVADRDSSTPVIRAEATDTINGHTYRPTQLVIIV